MLQVSVRENSLTVQTSISPQQYVQIQQTAFLLLTKGKKNSHFWYNSRNTGNNNKKPPCLHISGRTFAHMDIWMLSYGCLKASQGWWSSAYKHKTWRHPSNMSTSERWRLKWNVVVFAFLGIPHKNVYFKFQRCIHVASGKNKQKPVFCVLPSVWLQNIGLTLMCFFGLWILGLISVCFLPQSAFTSLAGGLFWWQCTLRKPCKCYDLWLMRDPYVCVRQWEQSHVPRTTKALRRRPFEELVQLVVCFSALLPPNGSGCSRRLTAVGRFARAFVRQKRDHSGRALAFSKTSSEDRKKGRWREGEGGGRWGQRESKIKKRERESSPFGNSAGVSFMSSMLGSESLPAGPGVRVCS